MIFSYNYEQPNVLKEILNKAYTEFISVACIASVGGPVPCFNQSFELNQIFCRFLSSAKTIPPNLRSTRPETILNERHVVPSILQQIIWPTWRSIGGSYLRTNFSINSGFCLFTVLKIYVGILTYQHVRERSTWKKEGRRVINRCKPFLPVKPCFQTHVQVGQDLSFGYVGLRMGWNISDSPRRSELCEFYNVILLFYDLYYSFSFSFIYLITGND